MEKEKSICKESNFNKIVSNIGKNLRNYLFYLSGNMETADDIAQDSFVTLWKNCDKVEYDTAHFYVFNIAKNSFLKLKRREKVILKYHQRTQLETERKSPHFLLEEKQFKEQLLAAIDELSEPQRTAFLMNRIDNMTYREIADTLGISVKAVEKRIHNALKNLYNKVEQIKNLKI